MINKTELNKVIEGLECCIAYDYKCNDCPYKDDGGAEGGCYSDELKADALMLLKSREEEITALRRLVEWAEECGFGLDNIYWEEYVNPEELEGMGYIEQLIYIAKKAVKKDE